jgi:hypothetical protein
MKVTLTPKLFPVSFPAGTLAGVLVYAIASAALAADGVTPAFAAEQESDGVSPVVFANVPDGEYTLTESRKDAAGAVLGDPFVQTFSIASPVLIDLPSGAAVEVGADDPPTP